MCSGSGLNSLTMRNNVTRMATMKHEQQGAPVFTWYFTWQSPMLEDAGAWHTAELAFCFDNTARCAQGTGNGPEAQALARQMATAWANFARTGNPGQPGLPWTPFTPDGCPYDGLRCSVSHRDRSGSRGPEDSVDVNSTSKRRSRCRHASTSFFAR
jgi:para-nitrobenzyl esterase